MKNEINGLKFTDEVEFDNDMIKQTVHTVGYIKEIHNCLDMLQQQDLDSHKRALLQEEIIDQIYCCYVEAMRWDLTYGAPSKTNRDKLVDLQDRMLALSNETGQEFLKLQTGFINILISYIDRNS